MTNSKIEDSLKGLPEDKQKEILNTINEALDGAGKNISFYSEESKKAFAERDKAKERERELEAKVRDLEKEKASASAEKKADPKIDETVAGQMAEMKKLLEEQKIKNEEMQKQREKDATEREELEKKFKENEFLRFFEKEFKSAYDKNGGNPELTDFLSQHLLHKNITKEENGKLIIVDEKGITKMKGAEAISLTDYLKETKEFSSFFKKDVGQLGPGNVDYLDRFETETEEHKNKMPDYSQFNPAFPDSYGLK